MQSSLRIPVAILLGGLILALAVYFSMTSRIPKAALNVADASFVRPVASGDHILGNPAAQVFVIEYTDFDCTFCKDFHATMHEIIANEGTHGDVAWVLRHFPLTEIHPNAEKHARAAECAAIAGGNDAFWRFADALYANQPVEPTRYGALAAAAGIPTDAFAACYEDAEAQVGARVLRDRENALQSGARGTPYSLIVAPGKSPVVLDGAYAYDAVRFLLEDTVASLGE